MLSYFQLFTWATCSPVSYSCSNYRIWWLVRYSSQIKYWLRS